MFGYVKPFVPDLRVREHEMYRAVYCGLCRSMGKRTGCLSRITLSYDFAFLCAVRMVLEKTEKSVKVSRCMASPLKVRPVMEDNPALSYCSAVAAILTRAKVMDDIADGRGRDRFRAKMLLPPASSMAKKALRYDKDLPVKEIEEGLSRLAQLEREGCESLDTVADCFGDVLSAVFAKGLQGAEKAIAATLGKSIGRIIYVLDCADDREKDKEKNNYNPLNIEPISSEALSAAVRLELSKAEAAVSLMDFEGVPELSQIILNVIYEGLPKEADRIFEGKKCDCNKERS